ncbi:hypothetical protein Agub_g9225, partial [Astrephomene gubernaculifera]
MASAVVKALIAARQKCLSEDEAYWNPKPDFSRPISPRNEAAALSWLLDHQPVVCRGGPADVAELHSLCASYCTRLGAALPPEEQQVDGGEVHAAAGEAPSSAAAAPSPSSSGRSFEEASREAALLRWCVQRGLTGAASPALFGAGAHGDSSGTACGSGAPPPSAPYSSGPPPLRGLRADTPVSPGDVVLHVPQDLLISYDTAKQSDLGKVLCALPLGLSDDSIALIWSCVERREPEAEAAPFWAALPDRFAT